jgi:hypothetical protein
MTQLVGLEPTQDGKELHLVNLLIACVVGNY